MKVQTNKTPTVELTEGQQSLIQTRQISSSTVLSAEEGKTIEKVSTCLLYTSDAADDLLCVDLGGRRILHKKHHVNHSQYVPI